MAVDTDIRLAAFNWLRTQTEIYGDVLPRSILERGFEFEGQRITIIGPQGIWKPKIMKLPLSITTVFDGPYDDSFSKEGFLNYKYRGTNPEHPANIGLRRLMLDNIPLIYFHAIMKGKYLATWPVYIINDNMKDLTFTVAVDDISYVNQEKENILHEHDEDFSRRSYITANVRQRLHQRSFRERVLLAYRNQCALCKLRHTELLDAAHIIPDTEKEGLPIVQNGISLCKIHHAAFDKNILGISPDYIIRVREDILHEIDGPMLKYGLQSLENIKIILPKNQKDWPDRDRLDQRFKLFQRAG